jgi:glycosyltransferase involved in cell wall biosynthesis
MRSWRTAISADGRHVWALILDRLPVVSPAANNLRLRRQVGWLQEISEVTIFAPCESGGFDRFFSCPRRRLPGASRPRSAFPTLLGILGIATPWLLLRMLRERPALILVNNPIFGPAVWALRRILRSSVPVVVDVMGIQSHEVERTPRHSMLIRAHQAAWKVMERMLYPHADLVVAINQLHADTVREMGAADPVVLRSAADERPPSSVSARGHFGIPEDRKLIVFVGALMNDRLEPLFASWSRIGDEYLRRAALVIVGGGPDLELSRARAKRAGWLGDSVFLTGGLPQEEAMNIAGACDIAYSECWSDAGFPMKIWDYMALGLPMIVEAKPQMAEVLAPGENALFWRDVDELTGGLRRLIDDDSLRESLAAGARDCFRTTPHTWEARKRLFLSQVERLHD